MSEAKEIPLSLTPKKTTNSQQKLANASGEVCDKCKELLENSEKSTSRITKVVRIGGKDSTPITIRIEGVNKEGEKFTRVILLSW